MNQIKKTAETVSEAVTIDQKLIEEGTAQLTSEISVLEAWLQELEASEGTNTDISATRKSYHDMLRSRREMLSTLATQSKPSAITTD